MHARPSEKKTGKSQAQSSFGFIAAIITRLIGRDKAEKQNRTNALSQAHLPLTSPFFCLQRYLISKTELVS